MSSAEQILSDQDYGLPSQSSSFFFDEHGILDRLTQASELPVVQPPVSHRQTEASSDLRILAIDASSLLFSPNLKSRIAALKFDSRYEMAQTGDISDFVSRIAKNIELNRKTVTFGFGFHLKYYTFFVVEMYVWVVLTALHPLPMKKWHKIFLGLRALEIAIPRHIRDAHMATQESLVLIAQIFRDVTSIDEMSKNRVDCVDPSSQPQKKRTPTKRRLDEVDEPATGTVMRAREVPPAVSSVFVYDSHILREACLTFLKSAALPDVREARDMFLRHLEHSSDPEYGHIGRFLLSGLPLEQFSRVVHLRLAVHRVLFERYGISGKSLRTSIIAAEPVFQSISPTLQDRLLRIGCLFESNTSVPVYAFVDPVRPRPSPGPVARPDTPCADVHPRAAVPLHRGAERARDHGSGAEGEGLLRRLPAPADGGEPHPVCPPCASPTADSASQQIWWLTAVAVRMSNFLSAQADDGFALPSSMAGLLFEPQADERVVLQESLREFPPLARFVDYDPDRDFMLGKKATFWRNKLSAMVRAARRMHWLGA